MSVSRLHDDLLQEYKEERKLISKQLELFDPLGVSLRKPAAQRLLSKGILIFYEVLCYLLFLGAMAFAVIMNRLRPFQILEDIRRNGFKSGYNVSDIEILFWAVTGFVVLIGLLFYILARVARKIRLKNNILDLAGKNIKELVGQHLQRKAAIDAIDQRHFRELPDMTGPAEPVKINDVINPGYDG